MRLGMGMANKVDLFQKPLLTAHEVIDKGIEGFDQRSWSLLPAASARGKDR